MAFPVSLKMEEVMDVLTPVLTGALLALFTAIQTWITKGRVDALEQRVDRRFDHIDAEIASLRSDLLQVALAATGRRETG